MAAANKIMIVEDDKFLSRALSDKLKRESFEVVNAFDGEEGLAQLEKDSIGLILLDLVMPNMNGFQFLEEMKKNPKYKKTKVIVLSNLGQEEDITKAKELGAQDYLVKADFSLKEVVEKINKTL